MRLLSALQLLAIALVSPSWSEAAPRLSPTSLHRLLSPSVVVITVPSDEGGTDAFGSGVVVSPSLVASNCHVLESGETDRIIISYRDADFEGELVHKEQHRDLCLVHVPGLPAPAVQLGSSDMVEVGSRVFTIGAPGGFALTLSDGLVSGIRMVGSGKLIQTTAPIFPGSSGGGLFNEFGRLVGITTLRVRGEQGLNFAIPAEWIEELLTQWHRVGPEHLNYEEASSDALAAEAADQAAAEAALKDLAASGRIGKGHEPGRGMDADRWVVYYVDEDMELAFDSKTVVLSNSAALREQDRSVIAWVKVSYVDPRTLTTGVEYASYVQRRYLFCNSRQMSSGSTTIYDLHGKVVASSVGNPNSLEMVVPGTISEYGFHDICDRYPL